MGDKKGDRGSLWRCVYKLNAAIYDDRYAEHELTDCPQLLRFCSVLPPE